MDIGRLQAAPIPLEAKGFYVRNLSDRQIEARDVALKAMPADADEWDVLRYKAAELLCDENGQALEGTETTDALRERLSKGVLRDLIAEAEEVLVVGKRRAALVRVLASNASSSSQANTTQTA